MVFFIFFWCLPFNGQMLVINISYFFFFQFYFSVSSPWCVFKIRLKNAQAVVVCSVHQAQSWENHFMNIISKIFLSFFNLNIVLMVVFGAGCWYHRFVISFQEDRSIFSVNIFHIFSIHSIYKLNYGLVNDVKWIRWPTNGFIRVHSSSLHSLQVFSIDWHQNSFQVLLRSHPNEQNVCGS